MPLPSSAAVSAKSKTRSPSPRAKAVPSQRKSSPARKPDAKKSSALPGKTTKPAPASAVLVAALAAPPAVFMTESPAPEPVVSIAAVRLPSHRLKSIVDQSWCAMSERLPNTFHAVVVDQSERAATFLQYSGAAALDAGIASDLLPERLRKALIAGLRHGNSISVNLHDTDLRKICVDAFNRVQPGLWAAIESGRIYDPAVYLTLVKPEDGDQFDDYRFTEANVRAFHLTLVTRVLVPEYLGQTGFTTFDVQWPS